MKIALAQIDMRLGDLGAICARVADQGRLAAAAGADLLCVPAPLVSGIMPGSLVTSANFEHDLVEGLKGLARELEQAGPACLVPAAVASEEGPLFELFLLREGRVIPLRSALLRARREAPINPWAPAVFEAAGSRIAATFDFERDVDSLPPGCDLLVYFQVNGFDVSDTLTAPAVAAAHGAFSREVAKAGAWMACMAPIGGFDGAVYTGGSFVMDDAGRIVAMAPSFEETLLVQEVRRGEVLPALPERELPVYSREEWLWEALRLHLRDAVRDAGRTRAAVLLAGDLPSSLLAALAVDALGPRNVIAFVEERPDAITPADEEHERERLAAARQVAARLNLRLFEHAPADLERFFDRPLERRERVRLRRDTEVCHLVDAARALLALPLCPLTKTDYALAPGACGAWAQTALAPFGDVCLTELEFLGRTRNRASAVLPPTLVTLNAVEDSLRAIIEGAVEELGPDPVARERAGAALRALEPSQVDAVIEAHVERGSSLDETPLAQRSPEAAAVLLMLIRRGEGARRRLPAAPVVSARSFSERAWPVALAWSDTGRHGRERSDIAGLVTAELERLQRRGERYGELARDELFDLLGDLLGIAPEQLGELRAAADERWFQEGSEQLEERIQAALEELEAAGELSFEDERPFGAAGAQRFFSDN